MRMIALIFACALGWFLVYALVDLAIYEGSNLLH